MDKIIFDENSIATKFRPIVVRFFSDVFFCLLEKHQNKKKLTSEFFLSEKIKIYINIDSPPPRG